ncbi:Grx4 family monothiol glutaredoxin [Algiphilus aromaticivorans]|uniref:Grx4 family monothiol glutaredoxin n=1 Tax=Algiphilus aromaticivorans TaxID=382454 RepID=UPI0005C18E5F|nr:Grx4 family monothiol glutaredoxin [Algiphilus aromaticivorans]
MTEASTDTSIHDRIDELVRSNDVVLFMKGTPEAPQCGFSATVVKALSLLEQPFTAVNVLEDDAVREGVKAYAKWQTIPQLYVRGEFVGGCDIVREMYGSGELRTLLDG